MRLKQPANVDYLNGGSARSNVEVREWCTD